MQYVWWTMTLARNRYVAELLLLIAGYLAYIGVKHLFTQNLESVAFENAHTIINLEAALGGFWEQEIQEWLLKNHSAVVVFFNWVYTLGFFPVLIPAALVLFVKRYPTYVYYRNVFLISYGMTWLVYLGFPTAPPRLMPEYGFVDTIELLGPALYNSSEAIDYYNQYSAMPSMHFGWTLLFGMLFIRSSHPLLKVFGFVYPALSLASIVVTGNHYFLDAVVGGAIILASFAIYSWLKHTPLGSGRTTLRGLPGSWFGRKLTPHRVGRE